MATQASNCGEDDDGDGDGVIARISQSQIVGHAMQITSHAAFVAKQLLKSTGKTAWIFGTTFLILVVPLLMELDREQKLNELELELKLELSQANIIGTSAGFAPPVE